MTALCDSSWTWASNSLNQNPCAIAGALEAPCRGLGSYTLGPLNNSNYLPPPSGSALPCECNTVMYSLFMACTACQGESIQTWSTWSLNCDAVYVTQYPSTIPSDTAVPHWAFLNVTTTGTWNQADSQNAADQPESSGVVPPVSTLQVSDTGANTLPTNTANNSSGGGSNVGAIAGGVVGGLAGIGILALLAVWFIMKRKRSKVAPSSAFTNNNQPQSPSYPKYEAPSVSPGPLTPPPMVYNPADPSTFPTAFHDPSIVRTTNYPQDSVPMRGQYRGAAEV